MKFFTPSWLYSYTAMSYGLWNMPATFQHLMNQVVAGLEGCTVHLDDVINYSETWIGNLCHLIRSLLTR